MRESGEREDRGGDRKSKSPDTTLIRPSTLGDLGVSKTQFSRWQKLADLPEDKFEERTAIAKRAAVRSVEATSGERADEKKAAREERERELGGRQVALPNKRYVSFWSMTGCGLCGLP
jgi:hypothetical protein